MITFWLFLNFSLMIIMVVGLAAFISSRLQVSWRLFGIGAATFGLSQVLHIPFNYLVLNHWQLLPLDTSVTGNLILLAIFLGLSAGVFEESARYLSYRTWAKDARSWGKGLMLGAGHGGVEALLVALIGFFGLMQITMFLFNPAVLDSLAPEQRLTAQSQLAGLAAGPWYILLLGAVERAFAMTLHLALSIMVLQAFLRNNRWWLLAAILWHAAANTTVVISIQYLTPITSSSNAALLTEGTLSIFALISLGIIFRLRTPEPEPEALPPLPPVKAAEPFAHDLKDDELLERSKYS